MAAASSALRLFRYALYLASAEILLLCVRPSICRVGACGGAIHAVGGCVARSRCALLNPAWCCSAPACRWYAAHVPTFLFMFIIMRVIYDGPANESHSLVPCPRCSPYTSCVLCWFRFIALHMFLTLKSNRVVCTSTTLFIIIFATTTTSSPRPNRERERKGLLLLGSSLAGF